MADNSQRNYFAENAEPERRRRRSGGRRGPRVLDRWEVDVIPGTYVVLVIIVGVCVLFASLNYLNAKNDAVALSNDMKTLQQELETLQTSNNELEKEITSQTDLNTIYKKATKEYGMVPAKPDQVILYDHEEREYVHQYEDVPE